MEVALIFFPDSGQMGIYCNGTSSFWADDVGETSNGRWNIRNMWFSCENFRDPILRVSTAGKIGRLWCGKISDIYWKIVKRRVYSFYISQHLRLLETAANGGNYCDIVLIMHFRLILRGQSATITSNERRLSGNCRTFLSSLELSSNFRSTFFVAISRNRRISRRRDSSCRTTTGIIRRSLPR